MPELPEVETTKSAILPVVINKGIKNINIYQKKLRYQVPEEITSTLINKTIKDVQRRGKYILIKTTAGNIIIHLGMTGCLKVVDPDEPLIKHDHVEINLKSGKTIRYNDPRKFGFILFTKDDPYKHKLIAKLGPEPLTRDFNANYLLARCLKSSKPIKNLIMDNEIVVGVGNIYATESLFKAGVLPQRKACLLTKEEASLLVKEIKAILKKSIKAGGTTLKDFYSPDGKPGYFKQSLLVYGRKNEACYTCDTAISQITLGQRTTTYCSSCQI